MLAILVGDARWPEFQETLDLLRSRVKLLTASTAEFAAKLLEEAPAEPELIVVAQARPGEFAPAQFEQLKRQAPLAPLLRVLGSLCEGDGRTGVPWPGAVSMYWHQAVPRLSAEIIRMDAGRLSLFALPQTLNGDDRLLAATGLSAVAPPRSAADKLIAIAAERFSAAEALSEACQANGYRTKWIRPGDSLVGERPSACIWDAAHWGSSELLHFEQLRDECGGVPLIALVSFPRQEDHRQLFGAGAAAVVSKPYLLADLFFEVQRAIDWQQPVQLPAQRSA